MDIGGNNATVLRPYQMRWANDPSRFALAVKSAQIGYSTGTAAWAVYRCMSHSNRLVILLSRSKEQSLELALKAKAWVEGYEGVMTEFFQDVPFEKTEILQHILRFKRTNSRIIALAAKPETARGYTGDIVLDEFAFHEDSEAIFKAAFRQTTLGFSMRVLSTPNGQQGRFYEMAKSLGFDLGIRPPRQPVKPKQWSGHWCDIYLAHEEGFPADPEEIHAAAEDEDTWLQEYCCQFLSQATQWFPPELYAKSQSVDAGGIFSSAAGLREYLRAVTRPGANLYLGWDIARKRDLSVIWITELLGDVTLTRGILEMRNVPTPDQMGEARLLLPLIRKGNIDQTGMGLAIAEQCQREFPGRAEGVQFTTPLKEELAVLGKRRAEEAKVRLPDNAAVKASFTAMKKSTNAIGQARFDAEHDSKYGHGDHWWAYCLAEAAANQPVSHLSEGLLAGTPRHSEFQPLPILGGMMF